MAMLLVFTSVSVAMPAVFALTPAQAASNFNSNANTNNTFNLALTLAQNINSYVAVWNGTFSHSGNSYNTGSGNALGQFKQNVRNAFSGNAGNTAAGWFGSKTGENYCPSSPYSSTTTDAFGGTDGSADEPSHALQSGHNNRTWNEDITVSKSRSVADALSGDYANNPLGVPTSVTTSVTMTLYLSGKSDCNHYDSDGGWGHHRHVVEFWYFRAAPGVSYGSSNTNYPLTQVQNLKNALDAANKTQSNYTSASWSTYSSARSTAQTMWNAIYANPATCVNDTYNSTSIQNAATALNNAISGLQTTITINGNGGTPSASSANITVGSASTANFPTGSYTATRNGYTFKGWSTSSTATSGTTSGNLSVGLMGTVYATWAINSYTLTVNPNGGSFNGTTSNSTFTQNYNTTKSIGDASRTAYTFGGWTLSGSGSWNSSSKVYTYGAGAGTLTASWTPINYTITYNVNGGNALSSSTLGYNITSTSTLATPTRTGYSFAGWKPSADAGNWAASTTYSGGSSVNGKYSNVTLVAQWTVNQYSLTVNPNGGSFNNTTGNSSFTQNYGSTKTMGDATRTAYDFAGWTHSGYGSYNSSTKVFTFGAGTGTLTASWTPINYTITYNANGGSVSPATLGYNIESTSTLAEPTREGYSFTGWKPSADAGKWSASTTYAKGASVKTMYGNVTLVAQWQINQYTLTVDPNAGTWNGSTTNATFTQNYQSTKEIADPSRTGYTFTGWTLSGKGSWDAATKTFTYGAGAATLKAGWNANVYTVQFDGNGATGGSTASFYKTYEINATLPANGFVKTGYTFKGWATSADGEKVYDNGGVMSNDLATAQGAEVTLYAVWEAIPYTVEIDLNSTDPLTTYSGPTGGIYEEKITLADPVRPGYTFTGWTLVSGSGTLSGSDYTFGPDNAKVKANWSAISYTLTLDANEGVVDPSTITGIIYDEVDVPDPSREGYDFTGWTKVSGRGTYANGKFTFSDDDAQLQASWEAIHYDLTIDLNPVDQFGGDRSADITYDDSGLPAYSIIGDEVTLGTPARTGYTFTGWELVSGNGTLADGVYTFRSSDAVVKATWEAIPYTVTLDTNVGVLADGVSNQIAGIIYDVVDIPTPTREGYTFIDWEKVSGEGAYSAKKFTFTASDATLKAQWEAIPYTLTVDLDTDDPTAEYTGTVAESYIFLDTVEIPDPTRTGYDFAGWTITSDKAGSFIDKVYTFSSADVKFTANWTAHNYTIAFDWSLDEAVPELYSGSMDSVPATYDTAQDLPEVGFAKYGYTFEGWALEAGSDEIAYADGAEVLNLTTEKDVTVTLYAVWKAKTHTLTLDLGDDPDATYAGEQGPIVFTDKIIYDEIILEEPDSEGFTFFGWKFPEGKEKPDNLRQIDRYTWAYKFNDDDDGELIAVYKYYNVDVEVDPIGVTLTEGELPPGSDFAYTGQDLYTGRFKSTVTVPSPTRRGYTFTGWDIITGWTPSKFTSLSFDGETMKFGSWDQKIKATWEPITYHLAFDLNTTDAFGNDCAEDITYALDDVKKDGILYETIDLGAEPVRDGYTFVGWEISSGDGTVNNEDETFVFTDSDATLKAIWNPTQYNVEIVTSDGTWVATYSGDANVVGIVHEQITLGTAARRGYDFVEWILKEGKGSVDGNVFTFGSGNAVVEAVWEAQRYTISVDLNKQEDTYPIDPYGDVTYGKPLVYENKIIFDQIDLGDKPSRYGFTFTGWTADVGTVEADGKTYTVDNDNATITANWALNSYKVTFLDETMNTKKTVKVRFQDTVDLPVLKEYVPIDVDKSYHFLGWADRNGNIVDEVGAVTKNVTFKAVYEITGHNFTDWEEDNIYTHSRVCTDCGYVDRHDHDWQNPVLTTKPTCYTTGIMTYTCSVCGMKGAIPVDALGHDWTDWTPVPGDEADCEHGGSEHRFCKRCGYEDVKKVMPLYHDLANSVTGEGYCKHCGKFICTSCDHFHVLEQMPGIGPLYKIIHFFIHTFRQIRYKT
ncbi:MAG: InlB B-repeat-containing protein [Clostridia bacterium]|nr:InlB B-repeat-containing protein [Clostridia bacterium]